MSSINGTVKAPVANTPLTAKQTKILDNTGKFAGAKADHNKPLRGLVGKVVDRFVASPLAATRNTQARQLHEVAAGVRKGTVSAKEAEALLQSQQTVASATQRAMSDGKLSVKEKIELSAMQQNAQKLIDTAVKSGLSSSLNGIVNIFNTPAKRQADQLDKLADGIAKGTITRAETGKLLGQQEQIADARGDADSTQESTALKSQQTRADEDLERHSKSGTQLDLKKIATTIGRKIAG
ncbi:hypothetical protein [Hyalangium sp.]|uniref:hypothetical protein n=1 Tax=Hyalangium sp. TaxID=2028555 RepID=UPI002D5DDA5A|nr:hypothetical protein [Hyalangium sp.]HYI00392.1 hypothetical protein [Hyalangium sp.]